MAKTNVQNDVDLMNSTAGPLAARRIGKLTVEEFPASVRIDVPRQFRTSIGIFMLFGILSLLSLLLAKNGSQRDGAIFYMVFATIILIFRLTMRNVITVSDSAITVLHKNFGISWWKSHYQLDPNCNLRWVPAKRKAPSALEFSCSKRAARFAFEITQEEAIQVLDLLTQRFGNLRKSSDT